MTSDEQGVAGTLDLKLVAGSSPNVTEERRVPGYSPVSWSREGLGAANASAVQAASSNPHSRYLYGVLCNILLFDGYGFGEVAWPVHVAIFVHGDVIGQHLQR